jgi:hypothetical protein
MDAHPASKASVAAKGRRRWREKDIMTLEETAKNAPQGAHDEGIVPGRLVASAART